MPCAVKLHTVRLRHCFAHRHHCIFDIIFVIARQRQIGVQIARRGGVNGIRLFPSPHSHLRHTPWLRFAQHEAVVVDAIALLHWTTAYQHCWQSCKPLGNFQLHNRRKADSRNLRDISIESAQTKPVFELLAPYFRHALGCWVS